MAHWLSWAGSSDLQPLTCFPRPEVMGTSFCEFLGSKFKSSFLHRKHFSHPAISPASAMSLSTRVSTNTFFLLNICGKQATFLFTSSLEIKSYSLLVRDFGVWFLLLPHLLLFCTENGVSIGNGDGLASTEQALAIMKTWSPVAAIVYTLYLSGCWWLSFQSTEWAVQHFVTTVKVSEDTGNYVTQFSKSGAAKFSEDRYYNKHVVLYYLVFNRNEINIHWTNEWTNKWMSGEMITPCCS